MTGKYSVNESSFGSKFGDIEFFLCAIANELAERNRLKRLEISGSGITKDSLKDHA